MVYNDTCISAFHDSIEAAKDAFDGWYTQQHPNVDDELANMFTDLVSHAERACELGVTGEAASEAMDSVSAGVSSVAHRISILPPSAEWQKSLITAAQEVESRGTIAWLQKLHQDHGTPDPSFNRQTTGPYRLNWWDVLTCKSDNTSLGMCHVSRRNVVAERIGPEEWKATRPGYTDCYKRIFPADSTTALGIKDGLDKNRTRAVRNVTNLLT